MKLRELLKDISIKETTADMDMEIKGISYDSRTVTPGDIFVAIIGYESDGHKYINSAVEKGAVCVLCERAPDFNVPYVLCENTRYALAVLSSNFFGRPADKMKIIGVTGTNGKTTTTNLIKNIIEHCQRRKVGLIGTNNNMIGKEIIPTERTTPESYDLQKTFADMLKAGCEYVVMEVSSHALYLNRVDGFTFEIGVFTNLTRDHLDFHKTMEDYGKAKALLFSKCRKGIVNIDDEYADLMLKTATCPIFTFSTQKNEADLVAKNIVLKAEGINFAALMTGRLERVELGIPGMFSVYNALAAMSTALCLEIDIADVAEALKFSHGVTGRVEVVPTGRDFTIIIDYSHTPDAL
jgi:UDP-N-acetylmuramoyl-L-alanyl-D-glutamate--2,6-diaminopimelate ligase